MKLAFIDILRALEDGREICGARDIPPDCLIDITRVFIALEDARKLLQKTQEDIFRAHGGKESGGRFTFPTPEQTHLAREAADAVMTRKVRLDSDLPKLGSAHFPPNASASSRIALRPFMEDEFAKQFTPADPALVDDEDQK